MAYDYIVKYKLMQRSGSPYDRCIQIETSYDLNELLQLYKDRYNHLLMSIVRVRYTSEINLRKDLSYDSRVIWSSDF